MAFLDYFIIFKTSSKHEHSQDRGKRSAIERLGLHKLKRESLSLSRAQTNQARTTSEPKMTPTTASQGLKKYIKKTELEPKENTSLIMLAPVFSQLSTRY